MVVLIALCPDLLWTVNMHDGPSDGVPRIDPRRGAVAEDMTIDSRITTTWIPAPRVCIALMKRLCCQLLHLLS